MTKYTFTLQTLTPLFIGNGEELRKDIDFVIRNGVTWRLNIDNVFDKKYEERKSSLPGKLLSDADFRDYRLFRYAVRGEPRSEKTDARLKACIKNVYDCPYVPGSSIKGAIRTVLAKRAISERKIELYERIEDDRKTADDRIEQEIFGKGSSGNPDNFPRDDIFRAVQVSDAMMDSEARKPGAGMEILNVTPISRHSVATRASVPIELEAVRKGQTFSGTITLDDFLLNGAFRDRRGFFDGWINALHDSGYERLDWLIEEWFKDVDGCESVHKDLCRMRKLKEHASLRGTKHALIQIGGGTGWDGMTYGQLLQAEDEDKFENKLMSLNILKATRAGFPRRDVGEIFPSSKKVVQNPKSEMKLESLLGWCLIIFQKVSG